MPRRPRAWQTWQNMQPSPNHDYNEIRGERPLVQLEGALRDTGLESTPRRRKKASLRKLRRG